LGAYTDIPWTSHIGDNQGRKEGSGNSFLFSLRDDMSFIQIRCIKKENEVWHRGDLLFCFGISDFGILNDCNKKSNSFSVLSSHYEKPAEIKGDKCCLAGASHFKVIEIEVYQVL
jgi:hypothetical protein